jgi:hypothetical protein
MRYSASLDNNKCYSERKPPSSTWLQCCFSGYMELCVLLLNHQLAPGEPVLSVYCS